MSDELKAFYARQMEVYAGFSENADHNAGRVIAAVEELGEMENTLIIWIWGDNGASMEGTVTGSFNELTMQNGIPLTDEMQLQLAERYGGLDQWGGAIMDPHYGAAWAWAGNTPFKWGKQVGSHLGGTRNPMVVHWPDRVTDAGGLRSQFTHVIDVAPTILEIAGIPAPDSVDGIEQEPMHGTSFTASLTDTTAPEHRTQQYFETIGNRAMYKDGWWLAARTARIPWVLTPDALKPYAPGVWNPDDDPTELYYLPDDFTQAHDLAAQHPDKVQELKDLFWQEAEKYKVLPLLATLSTFFGMLPPIPEETTFEFRGDVQNVMSGMIPRIYNRSYSISAELEVPEGGAEGVIVAEADHLGGFSLFVKDGKLTHTYSMMGVFVFKQVADEALPSGEVTVRIEFDADAAKPATGGEVTLFIDDRPVGTGRMDHSVPVRFSGYAGMDIGRDNGGVVDLSYANDKPFAFTGAIKKVVFDIKPHLAVRTNSICTPRPIGATRPTHSPARRIGGVPMGRREERTDVLIGGYLSTDAAHEDYESVLNCGAEIMGAVVVSKDLEGDLSVEKTDHMVKKGAEGLGRRGVRGRIVRAPAPGGNRDRSDDRCGRREGVAQEDRQQARGGGRQDDPDRRGWPHRRVQA